jgi:chromosome segregation ATPase
MGCSICAGTGELLTGETCVCGDGSAEGEAVALRARIAELEEKVEVREVRITRLEGERDALHDQVGELRARVKELDARVARPAIHDMFEDLQRDYFELQARVKELEAALEARDREIREGTDTHSRDK